MSKKNITSVPQQQIHPIHKITKQIIEINIEWAEFKPLLELQDLHAGYAECEVLKGINIKIKPHEIVALIGPNGAGKSTVLKTIFQLAARTKGTILFEQQDITSCKTHQLLQRGISYVPQGKINFLDLTIEENLELGTLHSFDIFPPKNIFSPKKDAEQKQNAQQIQQRKNHIFKLFPALIPKRHELAYTLSGGQQQMLALARSLMQNPQLILLDEPSLGLSPKPQQEVFALLTKLRDEQDISLLIVEQNAKKAIEIADRTYLLEDGKVVLEGDKAIIHNPKIKEVYLGGRY